MTIDLPSASFVYPPKARPAIKWPCGLYTLALFSAMTKQEASAKVALRQAKALNPDLVEFSKQDPT